MRISGSARAVLIGTIAVVVAVVAVVAGVAWWGRPDPGRTPMAGPKVVVAPAAGRVEAVRVVASLAVLRDWDRARAAAWASGDLAALGALYVPGAAAGRADVAMLRKWTERGLRVEGMEMQVLEIALHSQGARRLVLVVRDRLVGAVAVRPGGDDRIALPRDGASTRRLVFVKPGDQWLLASAREQEGEPQTDASPVASTEPASGSAKE